MKEILTKLNEVKDLIIGDNKLGNIVFFGLIKRIDLEDRWDILISATQLKQNNSVEDIEYIVKCLKNVNLKDLNFLSQIVLLTPENGFVNNLAKVILKGGYLDSMEEPLSDLKLSDDFVLSDLYIIYKNFSDLKISEKEKNVTKDGEKENFSFK